MEQAIKASSENLLMYLHRVVQYGRQLAVLRSVLSLYRFNFSICAAEVSTFLQFLITFSLPDSFVFFPPTPFFL